MREHSTTVTLIKNTLRHYCREKRKKEYMYRAIESASDVISHNMRAALQGDAIIIFIKLLITFNGNKLHRYD